MLSNKRILGWVLLSPAILLILFLVVDIVSHAPILLVVFVYFAITFAGLYLVVKPEDKK